MLRRALVLTIFLFPSLALSRDERYSAYVQYETPVYHYQPHQTIPVPPQRPSFFDQSKITLKEFLDGGLKGNAINEPTLPNAIGQLALGFTPLGKVGDIRDLGVSVIRSAQTGFTQYKKEIAWAGAGFAPVATDLKRLQGAWRHHRGIAVAKAAQKAEYALLVRSKLPALKHTARTSFEGVPKTPTLPKGTKIYRSPRAGEVPEKPGHYFSLEYTSNKESYNRMVNAKKWGNPMSHLNQYELTSDVTVHYGKVKGGTGFQIYIPDDIIPGKIMKWEWTEPFR